jgi:hypothetical protein
MPQHAALLAVLLHQRPTCLECAAAKSRLTVSQVNAYLSVISAALEVVRLDSERCGVCGQTRTVFSVHPTVS